MTSNRDKPITLKIYVYATVNVCSTSRALCRASTGCTLTNFISIDSASINFMINDEIQDGGFGTFLVVTSFDYCTM